MVKTCPICQRKFNSKLALKQHMDSAHSTKPLSNKARGRTRVNNAIKQVKGSPNDIPVRIKRTEYILEVVNSSDSGGTGKVIFNPKTSTSAKILNKFAGIYEMYRVFSMKVRFISASRSTRNGHIIVAVDMNAKDDVIPSKEALYAMPNVVTQVHTNSPVLVVPITNIIRYNNGSDTSRDKPFVIYYYCTADGKAKDIVGDIFIDYDIEFSGLNAS